MPNIKAKKKNFNATVEGRIQLQDKLPIARIAEKNIPNFAPLNENGIMAIEALVKEQCNELIADLIKWAMRKDLIEIRFEDTGDDGWSVTTLYDYKGDGE